MKTNDGQIGDGIRNGQPLQMKHNWISDGSKWGKITMGIVVGNKGGNGEPRERPWVDWWELERNMGTDMWVT